MRYFTFREQFFAFGIKTVIALGFTLADPILSFYFQASGVWGGDLPPPQLMNNRYKTWRLCHMLRVQSSSAVCTQPEVFTLWCHVIFVVLLVLKFYLFTYFQFPVFSPESLDIIMIYCW